MQKYEDYFKTCEYHLHRGPRSGNPCGKGCTFDVYGNRANFCSTHYVAYLRNPNADKDCPKSKPSHPTYQVMIVKAIVEINKGPSGVSNPAIQKYICATWGIPTATLKTQLRLALRRGVENGLFSKVRASYRLTAGTKAKLLVR